MRAGLSTERRAAVAAPFQRALFALLAILITLAVLPMGTSFALFSDTHNHRTDIVRSGSLGVETVPGTLTASTYETGSVADDCEIGDSQYTQDNLDDMVLADGHTACIGQTVEVTGSGKNLRAGLTITVDSSDLPAGTTVSGVKVLDVASPVATTGETVAHSADSTSVEVPGFDANGTAYFRILYTLEFSGDQCESGTCSETSMLPAVSVDAVQVAR